MWLQFPVATLVSILLFEGEAWTSRTLGKRSSSECSRGDQLCLRVLSDSYLENDLVAVKAQSCEDGCVSKPRLCVVRPDSTVAPLCQHEDDVETDLFLDPRCDSDTFWREASDEAIKGTYGEGWYGQRPVPSLGGGPGYGAEAQEIWSVDEELMEQLVEDGVELPMLDVGIAHGEKARGGSF